MAYEQIKTEIADGIMVLTLNRPDKLNAFTGVMMKEMIAAFDEADRNDDVRCVIVTGAGRGFCAGADLSAGAATFDLDKRADRPKPKGGVENADLSDEAIRDGGGRVTLRIYESLKPVIAAINGPAVGIGATMTLAMDARLVSTKARVGFVFGRIGIVPEAASSWFLPRIVGLPTALDLVLSADILDADAAVTAGLATGPHEPDELLTAAGQLADRWTKGRSPVAVALARQMLRRNAADDHPVEAHRVDSLAMFHTSIGDGKEGVAAFLEKRDPDFTGKASQMPDFYEEWVGR